MIDIRVDEWFQRFEDGELTPHDLERMALAVSKDRFTRLRLVNEVMLSSAIQESLAYPSINVGLHEKACDREAKEIVKCTEFAGSNAEMTPGRTSMPSRRQPLPVWIWSLCATTLAATAATFYFVLFHLPNVGKEQAQRRNEDPSIREHVADDEELKTRVKVLVEQLSSEDFEARGRAMEALIELGEKALPILKAIDSGDQLEQRIRIQEIVRRINRKLTLLALERLASGIVNKLSEQNPQIRQEAVLNWIQTVEKSRLAPALVELCSYLDPGPLLWGCWESLNAISANEAFSGGSSSAWALGEARPSISQHLADRRTGHNISFSKKAKEICDANPASDQNLSAPARVFLVNQVQGLGLGVCVTEEGEFKVLTPQEGNLFWRNWLQDAAKKPDWGREEGGEPNDKQIAAWIAALGTQSTNSLRAWINLRDHGRKTPVQSAIRTGASLDTTRGRILRELIEVIALRDAGKIYFNSDTPTGKMAVWSMNLDGSDQHPLFPEDLESRNWWSIWPNLGEHYILTDWNTQGIYLWNKDKKRPLLVESENVHFAAWRKDPLQLVYLKGMRATGGPGTIRIYDVRRAVHLNIPSEWDGIIETPALSPDGKDLAFERIPKEAGADDERSIWVMTIDGDRPRELLKLGPEHKRTGENIKWSADGNWISYTSYVSKDGYQGFLWAINIHDGSTRNILKGYRSSGMMAWALNGAELFFWAETQGKKEGKLLAFEPEKGVRELEAPLQKRRLDTLMDGRLYIENEGQSWVVDPSGKRPAQRFPGTIYGLGQEAIEVGGQIWWLGEMDGVAGSFARQIVLVSPDGKKALPITNRPEGCSSPIFQPKNR